MIVRNLNSKSTVEGKIKKINSILRVEGKSNQNILQQETHENRRRLRLSPSKNYHVVNHKHILPRVK